MAFKLGVGPMSTEIITILSEISNQAPNNPLMLIASMNQVDKSCGYVMNTKSLSTLLQEINSNIILCRDHCGPGFRDVDRYASEEASIRDVKSTIQEDIDAGFKLIHIDTSRAGENKYNIADELFRFALDLNPDIRFEFGSEENIGVAVSINQFKKDVDFCSERANIDYVVGQTGSLVYEDKQAGSFDVDVVQELVSIAEAKNLKLKEHNADYLNSEQIALRKQLGVHAVNIAPQLGVIQTQVTFDLATVNNKHIEWNIFAEDVIASGKWKKWTSSKDSYQKAIVAGHYRFNSDQYRKLVDSIGYDIFYSELKQRITDVVSNYIQ